MWFLIAGLALLALKFADIGPVAEWSWLWVLSPFGLAALWWALADATGLTRRRAMRKEDERKAERRERSLKALGLDTRRDKHARAVHDQDRRKQPDPRPEDDRGPQQRP